MFNKILVPLDGSKLAEKALPWAEEMGIHFGSKITLLNAGTVEDTPKHDEMQVYLNEVAAGMEQRMIKSGAIVPRSKYKISTVITGPSGLINDTAGQILNFADKKDMNMIIMATHGRTGFTRWVLGDTANKVARAFSCPILLIRAKTEIQEGFHLRKILAPLDGSKESEVTLPYIEAIAEKLKPEIKLLNVVELLYHVYAYPSAAGYGGDGIVRVPFNEEEMKPHREAGRKYIDGISNKLREKGLNNSAEVRVGSAGEEILEAEKEIKPDLLIMSTYGHSGFGRFDHGSITDKVLHAGNTPILLVRPQKPVSEKSVM